MWYRWTLFYGRDRDAKNMLPYNEFPYKKTNDHSKLEDRFQKKGHFFQLHICKFADKNNHGCLYF